MTDDAKIRTLGNFTWTIAELLRGDYKQFEYGKVILPFVVLRRLDCILEASKGDVLAAAGSLPDGIDDPTRDMLLFDAAGGLKVYNTSPLTFAKIKGQSPAQVHENLVSYVTAFSPSIRDVFLDKFKLMEQLKRLAEAELLWLVFERFTQIDLHPDNLSNLEMGYLFEDLIRRFSEISNETAGEHFTPREIVKLIVEMILANDHEALTGSGVIRTIYDPACGTGGMLALTEAELKAINPRMRVELYGQELNGESYAICKSDMLLSGHDPDQIAFGNTLSQDAHSGRRFHYMVSNPPYGVDWKKYADVIRTEAESLGHDGRFGAGLPRQSDGQLLFLQHMIAKMRDDEVGSQIGIVMNGSPLFTGGAGSGESEIRRWLLENDWVEAIVGLPNDIFYNTGIQTYVWLITNRKEEKRRGKVQLIDASSHHFWTPLRKSLGSKRREIGEAARDEIVKIYSDMLNGDTGFSEYSKIVDVSDFGFRELRIERPLRLAFQFTADRLEKLSWSKQVLRLDEAVRDNLLAQLSTLPRDRFVSRPAFEKCVVEVLRQGDLKLGAPLMKLIVNSMSERDQAADICRDRKGRPEPDATLRDFELVPLKDDWREHFAREVVPHCPEAWVDENHTDPQCGEVGRIGYEIPFNRFFAKPERLRSLTDLDADAQRQALELSALIQGLGKERSQEIQALARAKVKPSGIEWIDAIPEHWSVVPIRRSARLESGHTPSRQVPEYWIEEECTIDWFTLADVGTLRDGSVTYIEKTVNRISPLGMANSAARLLPSGTVILSRTASVGYSGILATPMAVSQDFAAWVCDERLLPEYLLLCLRCMKGEFRRLMMGSTHQTIYMPDISRLTIPLPPLEEQQAIAHAVLSRKGDQDALVSAASRTAEILRQRQQAFMFEAVTGKIFVSSTSVAERAA